MPRPIVNGTTREANRVRDRKQDYPRSEKNCAFIRACIVDTATPRNDHYRAIFGCKATNGTVSNMASRTWNAPAMKEYAEELRAELRERFMVTVEDLLIELEEARQMGKSTESAGPMVAATMGKAKLCGLDKQIIEHRGDIPVGAVTIEVVSARPENNGN
jgi:phage terminase small subunit